MKRLAPLLVLAGCRGLLGIEEDRFGDDAGDAAVGQDTNQQLTCFGAAGSFLQVCLPSLPTASLALSGSLNTSTDARCIAPLGLDVCVIAATAIDVTGTVNVSGTRPLILLAAAGSIAIPSGATLDVASHRGGKLGPGANPPGCGIGAMDATSTGGGAGGSFAGKGGRGGGVGGGAAGTPVIFSALRGGCTGGRVFQAGDGGGGGAVALIAKTTISVKGTINASGAGGSQGQVASGAGGGGAGGAILLDAPSVVIDTTGVLMAQGGGGGEGGGGSVQGMPGADPTTVGVAAPGGAGTSAGGDGGPGANGSTGGDGMGGGGGSGSGGGGGGIGVIRAFGTVTDMGKSAPPVS